MNFDIMGLSGPAIRVVIWDGPLNPTNEKLI